MNPVWPWGGHRRFAYDLVRWMRPARIAELGVHWGTSFFTFAQAVKDGRMKGAELIGVDTFEGEEHAGHYGPEVLETVQRIVSQHFARQTITLHRMYFRDALATVADESLDLLHIDGLHTFEAVKDDFESWLPKLAPEGVVLFHDVAPDTGYGSTDYWNRITTQHPGFAFEHSWGLGVLFPKGDSLLQRLRLDGLDDKLVAYTALAKAERAGRELIDVGEMARERLETVKKQGEKNAELRQQLADLREATVSAEVHRQAVTRAETAAALAKQRLEAVQKQSELIRQRDGRIESLTGQIETARKLSQERLEALNQACARAVEAERAGAKLGSRAGAAEAARDELRGRVGDLHERVKVQDERLAELREAGRASVQRNDDLRKSNDVLRDNNAEFREQNAALREKLAAEREAGERLREQLEATRAAHAAIDGQLADLAAHVAALVGSQDRTRKESAGKLAELAAAVEQARRAGEAAAATLAGRMSRIDVDADLLAMRAEHLEEVVGQHRTQLGETDARGGGEAEWLTGEAASPATPGPPKRRPRNS